MSKIDETIKLLFNKVEAKKQEVKRIQSPNYRTNMIFSYDESPKNSINLNVVNAEKELVEILAFIIGKRDYWRDASEHLKTHLPFTWQGCSFKDWEHDITARFEKVTVMKKQKELKVLEERLNQVVSPEMRRELEVAALAELLKD